MGELSIRAGLIAQAMVRTLGREFVAEVYQPPDRAVVIVRGMDFVGEFNLMTGAEMADGEWVHTDPHSGECPEAK